MRRVIPRHCQVSQVSNGQGLAPRLLLWETLNGRYQAVLRVRIVSTVYGEVQQGAATVTLQVR